MHIKLIYSISISQHIISFHYANLPKCVFFIHHRRCIRCMQHLFIYWYAFYRAIAISRLELIIDLVGCILGDRSFAAGLPPQLHLRFVCKTNFLYHIFYCTVRKNQHFSSKKGAHTHHRMQIITPRFDWRTPNNCQLVVKMRVCNQSHAIIFFSFLIDMKVNWNLSSMFLIISRQWLFSPHLHLNRVFSNHFRRIFIIILNVINWKRTKKIEREWEKMSHWKFQHKNRQIACNY